MNAKQCFDAGQLQAAIAAAGDAVRSKPLDHGTRMLLVDLLCFAGDFSRADKHLDTMAQLEPATAVQIALGRQLLRAEMARQEFFAAGRVPEVAGQLTPDMQARLQASLQIREQDLAAAERTLDVAEQARPHVAGSCDGKPFADLRDLDDLLAGILEVLSPTGKYYWVGLDQLQRLKFFKPETVQDTLWRRAEISVVNGPQGVVYIPVLYPGSAQVADDEIRLGRTADWLEPAAGPVRGLGHRMWWIDNEHREFLSLGEFEFLPHNA